MSVKKLLVVIFVLTLLVGCSANEKEVNNNKDAIGSLTFIGRSSVRIELNDGRVIYIDPAVGSATEYEKPADLVLVTHQHEDHNNINLVNLKDNGRMVQCPYDIKYSETINIDDIMIKAVPAYNSNHKKEDGCGFIIKIEGLTLYHSGDTSMIDEMKELEEYKIDYALLCMDGFYNMGPEEAAKVANLIKPRAVIPIHTSPEGLYDQDNIDKFKFENVIVLNVGESLDIK